MRLLFLTAFLCLSLGSAQTVNPLAVLRGDTVTVTTAPLTVPVPPAPPQAITITLEPQQTGIAVAPFPVPPATNQSFAFVVPHLTYGKWKISAVQAGNQVSIISPQAIEVTAKPPQIATVSPKVIYLAHKQDTFTVIGSGFSEDAADYSLNFLDDQSPTGYTQQLSADHRQLTFFGVKVPGRPGKKGFTVAVNGVASNPAEVTFSEVEPNTPRVWAVALLAGIVLLIYLLLRAGRKNVEHTVDGRKYFLTALFLDKQTNTYSLSQCQFYAWTAVSILGYIYLVTAKSLIQGSMSFPDIPAGLPGILLASAGTTVLAAGVASAKGDKGAGEIQPSLADFITTGGVVAAERLQFVVWTIVGISTFLGLVFLSDPATIDTLPQIPSGFLELMGISSAGYIGGKLARKAGPTITSIAPSLKDGILSLELHGTGLSQNAAFKIGDDLVASDQILGDKHLPEVIQRDENSGDPTFATILRLSIANPKTNWLAEKVELTITNPDQQKAVASYDIAARKIDSTSIDTATNTFTILGQAFEPNSKVTFDPPGVTGSAIAVADQKIAGTIAGVAKGQVVTAIVTGPSGLRLTGAPTISQ